MMVFLVRFGVSNILQPAFTPALPSASMRLTIASCWPGHENGRDSFRRSPGPLPCRALSMVSDYEKLFEPTDATVANDFQKAHAAGQYSRCTKADFNDLLDQLASELQSPRRARSTWFTCPSIDTRGRIRVSGCRRLPGHEDILRHWLITAIFAPAGTSSSGPSEIRGDLILTIGTMPASGNRLSCI